jgi:hypothetical protein
MIWKKKLNEQQRQNVVRERDVKKGEAGKYTREELAIEGLGRQRNELSWQGGR